MVAVWRVRRQESQLACRHADTHSDNSTDASTRRQADREKPNLRVDHLARGGVVAVGQDKEEEEEEDEKDE